MRASALRVAERGENQLLFLRQDPRGICVLEREEVALCGKPSSSSCGYLLPEGFVGTWSVRILHQSLPSACIGRLFKFVYYALTCVNGAAKLISVLSDAIPGLSWHYFASPESPAVFKNGITLFWLSAVDFIRIHALSCRQCVRPEMHLTFLGIVLTAEQFLGRFLPTKSGRRACLRSVWWRYRSRIAAGCRCLLARGTQPVHIRKTHFCGLFAS